MSTIDRQRAAAVRKLEGMGYTFVAGNWVLPANDAVAPVTADELHALLVKRADRGLGRRRRAGSHHRRDRSLRRRALAQRQADGGKG